MFLRKAVEPRPRQTLDHQGKASERNTLVAPTDVACNQVVGKQSILHGSTFTLIDRIGYSEP